MAILGLHRTVLVDASVNLVPFAILLLFMGLFLAYDPWPADALATVLAQGLLAVTVLALLVATGVVARLVHDDEGG